MDAETTTQAATTTPVAAPAVSSTPAPSVAKPTSVRPAAPAKTPPPEALQGSFDLDDDLGIDEGPVKSSSGSEPKATSNKASGVVATPATSVAATPSSTTATAVVNPLIGEPVKPSGEARDYSGFSEQEVGVLKKMSNDSFAYAAKIIKENKELGKLKDSTYLQSPEAYKLDPQYTKAVEDASYISKEAQIWRSQLIKIKSGNEWTPLLGWDKAGNPVFDKPRPAGELDEEDVRNRMNQCDGTARQIQQQLGQMQQGYTTRVQTDNAAIDAVQKEKFSWVADPALVDKTISMPGIGERSIKQIREDFMGLIPNYHRGNKLAELGANMFAALQIYAAEIRNLQAQNQLSETKRADVLRAEPTSTTKPGITGGVAKSKFGGPATFDIGGLPE